MSYLLNGSLRMQGILVGSRNGLLQQTVLDMTLNLSKASLPQKGLRQEGHPA